MCQKDKSNDDRQSSFNSLRDSLEPTIDYLNIYSNMKAANEIAFRDFEERLLSAEKKVFFKSSQKYTGWYQQKTLEAPRGYWYKNTVIQ